MIGKKGSKGGRETGLTPEVRDAIISVLRAGNFRVVACRAAGVHVRTFRRWLARGRDETSGVYRELLTLVEQAEHEAETAMVANVFAAATADARHAQWWLERKFPQRWSRDRNLLHELRDHIRRLEEMVQAIAPTPPVEGR